MANIAITLPVLVILGVHADGHNLPSGMFMRSNSVAAMAYFGFVRPPFRAKAR
jgi:hypothetical protein